VPENLEPLMVVSPMRSQVRIETNSADRKIMVFWNGVFSHAVNKKKSEELLRDTGLNLWKSDVQAGAALGEKLYDLLNGCVGKLEAGLEKANRAGTPFYLYLVSPTELSGLPFEILWKKNFLLQEQHPRIYIIRLITERNRLSPVKTKKPILKVLFTACSPVGLRSDAILQFEKEEESILTAMERLPVDLTIEDSGSLNGIGDAIRKNEHFDIIHISGHAGFSRKSDPVFFMEDDIGRHEKVTPNMLWEVIKLNPSCMLFLSGCSTGGRDGGGETESFAYQMIRKGVSIVLGWGLPVSDIGSTRLSVHLYKFLGMGKNIAEAINLSIKEMVNDYPTWPLLRLFTDGSSLESLIPPLNDFQKTGIGKTTYKSFKERSIRVPKKSFVGRRRETQKGLRTLRGVPGKDEESKLGLVIRGPAGIGKSCLAAKLIERLKEMEPIVFHGELKVYDILFKIHRLIEFKKCSLGLQILKADLEFEEKIRRLFHSVFSRFPVMFYFDEFDHNLELKNERFEVKKDVIPVIKPILEAVDRSRGSSRLMFSSRYAFKIVFNWNDFHHNLGEITLMAFRNADLQKKISELPNIIRSFHKGVYLKYGCGNPRLLEWMEIVAESEGRYDIQTLENRLEGKKQDFIEVYLADISISTANKPFNWFIHKSSVFRQPERASAFKAVGAAALLEKGVDLTFFEKEDVRGQEAVYWVMPVIRERYWKQLDTKTRQSMHRLALDWYEQKITESATAAPNDLEEALYHALMSGNIRIACRHAVSLGAHLKQLLLYREAIKIQSKVTDKITESVKREAIEAKDANVSILFNQLGTIYRDLGEADKARLYFEKALILDLKIFGDGHPKVATRYNNLGIVQNDLGNPQGAIEYFKKAQAINLQIFGEKHPQIALSFNNIGVAFRELGNPRKAIFYFEKSLSVDLSLFGEKDATVAIDYNNLATAYRDLGDTRKAIVFFEKARETGLQIFGEKHPHISSVFANLGTVHRDLGDASKAISYYQKSLSIDLDIFGDKHPHIAYTYSNLGMAYRELGEISKAIDYFEKAFLIDRLVVGENHPHVALDLSNLGIAYRDQGRPSRALVYLEKALEIMLESLDDNHPHVAATYNNFGKAYRDLGDSGKAVLFHKKALSINLNTFGEFHPGVAVCYDNLGCAFCDLGDTSKARVCHEKAIEIYFRIFGEDHPKVATCYYHFGNALNQSDEIEKGILYYRKALEIYHKFYKQAHPQIQAVKKRLENANAGVG
jgi:tetratricopeptide (TPR) repeat protein